MRMRHTALALLFPALIVLAFPSGAPAGIVEEQSLVDVLNLDMDFIDNDHRFNLNGTGGLDVVRCDTCAVQDVVDLGTSEVLWQLDRAALGLGPVRLVAFADLDGDGSREAVLQCHTSVVPPGGTPGPACTANVVVVDPSANQIELILGNSNDQYTVVFVGDVDGDSQDELAVIRFDNTTQAVTTMIFGPGGTTPVAIEDLTAASAGASVILTWRLTEDPARELFGVQVQRAAAPEGPYVTVSQSILNPAPSMSFEDVEVEAGRTLWYRLMLVRRDGASRTSRPIGVVTSAAAAELDLRIAHPPGDAGPVEIRYRLAHAQADVRLGVYDIRGRLVRHLDTGPRHAGEWTRSWDRLDGSGRPVARGVYVLQLEAADVMISRKVVLSSR